MYKINLKMKSLYSLLFSLFSLITLYSSLFTPPAHAQSSPQTLRVTPFIISFPLSPGKIYQHPITVENLSDNPLPLKASLNDFLTTGEEGGYVFEESRTNPLLSWITLSETDLILGAKEKKALIATIATPDAIPLGGYYGMLFFEQVPQFATPGTTQVLSRVGVLLLANVGVPDPGAKKADILTFSTGLIHQENTIPYLLRVKNVSLHYFTAKPILTISKLLHFGENQPQIIYPEEKLVFQDKIRRWEDNVVLTDSLPNIYKISMQVSTGNGEFVKEDRYLIIFPYIKAAFILIPLLLAVFLIAKRKRLNAAFKELYRK